MLVSRRGSPVSEVSGLTISDPWALSAVEVAIQLGTDPERGLSDDDAQRRLATGGANLLRSRPPTPAWRRLLAQFREPLVALLLVAIVVAVATWAIEGAHGWPIDAVVIFAIILLNAVIGFAQEYRAAEAVAALRRMTATRCTVLRGGRARELPAESVVVGDVLLLAEGDAVAADARLVDSSGLRVQEASLTGESEAVSKSVAVLEPSTPLPERADMVFRGTAVVQGRGRGIVTATGMGTEVGAIAELLDAAPEVATPLQREVQRLGRMLGLLVVAIAIAMVLVIVVVQGIRDPGDLATVLLLGVALAVAAVPEGLPAIMAIVLALGTSRLAQRNAIVKSLDSVETLGAASVICTDKTGTLTRNEMTVERVFTSSGGFSLDGDRDFHDGAGEVGTVDGEDPARIELRAALRAGCLANDARSSSVEGRWEIVGEPTEAAILRAGVAQGVIEDLDGFRRLDEVPFTSERKMMSTLNEERATGRRIVFAKGAPDVLLERCTDVQVGADTLPLDEERRRRLLEQVAELSGMAYRTLAVASRPAGEDGDAEAAEHGMVFVGLIALLDPPRTEAAAAIAEAKRAGIRPIMITGDHPATAARIAGDLGILDRGSSIVTVVELDRLSDAELVERVRTAAVFARVAPKHKLRIVSALQQGGQVVAMTGDGVNDAPALKAADIGIAMGITGTEVAKEAARMVLADDDFATIVAAVRQGRVIYDNVRTCVRYLLSSNIGEVLTVFLAIAFAGVLGLAAAEGEQVILPLLATQILWINLITDSGPALALGVDRPVGDPMSGPPRRVDARIVDAGMLRQVLGGGIVMALAALAAMDLHLPGGLLGGSGTLELARTAGFTTLVLAQLFNAFSVRSATASAFRRPFSNPWLWATAALGVALQVLVVQVPLFGQAFGTVPLPLESWLQCLALASSVLWWGELRKAISALRRRGTR